MSSVDMFTEELSSINRDFPGFTIKPKAESSLCKIIFCLLWILTLGKTKFMTDYITVLGKTMYVHPNWTGMSWLDRWVVLRHEGIHLCQANRMFFGRCFWIGWLIWAFAYLFILPFGLTLRSRWEREAYTETVRCSQRFGIGVNRARLFAQFTGPQYFWMDLRRDKISEWLDQLGVAA